MKKDWSPSKIVGAIRVKGSTLRALSRANGLGCDTLRNALYRHCPKYEFIIANYLGVPVSTIWPSRYEEK